MIHKIKNVLVKDYELKIDFVTRNLQNQTNSVKNHKANQMKEHTKNMMLEMIK